MNIKIFHQTIGRIKFTKLFEKVIVNSAVHKISFICFENLANQPLQLNSSLQSSQSKIPSHNRFREIHFGESDNLDRSYEAHEN